MSESEELAHLRGSRRAYSNIATLCLRELGPVLGYDHAAWTLERDAAVDALRDLCGQYGSNDWPDDLHLADIIRKHLAPYLVGEDEAN